MEHAITTSLRLLGAVAIAASTLASPAFAQMAAAPQAPCPFTDPNCHMYGPGNPYSNRTAYHARRVAEPRQVAEPRRVAQRPVDQYNRPVGSTTPASGRRPPRARWPALRSVRQPRSPRLRSAVL